MLRTNTALTKLSMDLQACIDSLGLHSDYLGQPAVVEKAAKVAERTFQGYSKAQLNRDDAHAAARDFLNGKVLDEWRCDLIASVLSDVIPTAGNRVALAHPEFSGLLANYKDQVSRGDLWRLTWHGLLTSYFSFNPVEASAEASNGWAKLRSFLAQTWPQMSEQSGNGVVPDWISVLRLEASVLTASPVDKYAEQFLAGKTEGVDRLKTGLGIPYASWFWHQLVLGAVRIATRLSDSEFISLIPRLIELIQERPAFRDEAIELILIRYHGCKNPLPHDELREFVIRNDVWRSPKLKTSGMAPAWNRVPDEIWRMVMAWVTERALKDFFAILATRNSSDAGRLAFWSQYLQQITWTRLVFGSETMALQYSNKAVKDLIARESGQYAELTTNKNSDAFMMQIGRFLAVEFSVTSNAGYIYDLGKLRFDRNAKYYSGGTDDLKYGFSTGEGLRILHKPDWEISATQQLKSLGIFPDKKSYAGKTQNPSTNSESKFSTTPTQGVTQRSAGGALKYTEMGGDTAKFPMSQLEYLVEGFNGAKINDMRDRTGGRLWVEDVKQSKMLGNELERLGFWWSTTRNAWYYRGN